MELIIFNLIDNSDKDENKLNEAEEINNLLAGCDGNSNEKGDNENKNQQKNIPSRNRQQQALLQLSSKFANEGIEMCPSREGQKKGFTLQNGTYPTTPKMLKSLDIMMLFIF